MMIVDSFIVDDDTRFISLHHSLINIILFTLSPPHVSTLVLTTAAQALRWRAVRSVMAVMICITHAGGPLLIDGQCLLASCC